MHTNVIKFHNKKIFDTLRAIDFKSIINKIVFCSMILDFMVN